MRIFVGIAAALALICGVSAASAQSKIPVAVQMTGDDAIGRQLAFHLRDQIGRSGTFSLNDSASLKVVMVTLNPDNDASRTIYNYTFLIAGENGGLDLYLTGGVGVCGKSRVQECGLDVMTALGEQVELMRQLLAKAPKSDFN